MTLTRRQMLIGSASIAALAVIPARALAASRVAIGFDPSGPAGDMSASVACERMPDGSIRFLSISLVQPR